MPYGYTGKILHVDLNHHSLKVEEPPEAFYRKYMGGSAMGMFYILRDLLPGVDALDPRNVLTIMASPLTGTTISGQSRVNVTAKSPISGAIGDSQGGGYFPAELKFAGFDGIVVTGRSEQPLYLSILNGEASLKPADHLMGLFTGQVEAALRQEIGEANAEVLTYGPAAENGVIFSSLVSMASRNNGRTGMGLVMASKNLRAIVVRGKMRPQVADIPALKALHRLGPKWLPDNIDVDPLGKYGTASVVSPQNSMGTLPTHNYTLGQFDQADAISGEVMFDTILKDRETCYACVVRCKRVVEIKEGPHKVDPLYGGPEYETLSTFGSYCDISDLAAIAKANEICNMYGVDTISCGATIAFAMECFEKGILTTQDTGGLELKFGDADAMLAALDQIVNNRGPLAILSQGSARAAEAWGASAAECLVTVKKTEAPAHMPQAKKSLAVIYAVNPFGADHQSSEHDPMYEDDIMPLYRQRLAELHLENPQPYGSLSAEKVRFAAYTQIFYSILDTLELCQFVWGPAWSLYGPVELVEYVNAVTGWQVTLDELMRLGERRLNLMRQFNAREGLTRQDDALPKKFFKALGGDGPTGGVAIDKVEFEAALDTYYALMGWTSDGLPTASKLAELGIDA